MHYSLLNQPLTVLYKTIFDRWYPFDTPSLEHCIAFNGYKICTVLKYEISPKPGNVLDFFTAINFTINPFNPFIKANLCWRHCLHLSSLAYDLTHRNRNHIYELHAKVERAD